MLSLCVIIKQYSSFSSKQTQLEQYYRKENMRFFSMGKLELCELQRKLNTY
jgi:hypothetical protein